METDKALNRNRFNVYEELRITQERLNLLREEFAQLKQEVEKIPQIVFDSIVQQLREFEMIKDGIESLEKHMDAKIWRKPKEEGVNE